MKRDIDEQIKDAWWYVQNHEQSNIHILENDFDKRSIKVAVLDDYFVKTDKEAFENVFIPFINSQPDSVIQNNDHICYAFYLFLKAYRDGAPLSLTLVEAEQKQFKNHIDDLDDI